MIYTIPTKRGVGIELWGTYGDLDSLYNSINKFWNDEHFNFIKGAESRNKLIASFAYEIRKAMEHSPIKTTNTSYLHRQSRIFRHKLLLDSLYNYLNKHNVFELTNFIYYKTSKIVSNLLMPIKLRHKIDKNTSHSPCGQIKLDLA